MDQSTTTESQGKISRGIVSRTPNGSITMGISQISLVMGSLTKEEGRTIQKEDNPYEDDSPSRMHHGGEDEEEEVTGDET